MKYVTTKYIYVFIIFLASINSLSCVTIGSNTDVSRQGNVLFPTTDTDNKIDGFAAFDSGFTLEDSSTSCTYESHFPVSGSVSLNNGTLYLLKDLLFDEGTTIVSMGDIYGDGHVLECSSSVTALWASSPVAFDNISLFLRGNIALQSSITAQGSCIVNGSGKEFIFEDSAQLTVASGGQLTFKNIKLSGLDGTNLLCADDTASVRFKNCLLCLDNNFEFSTGSMFFNSDVVISGTNQITYSSDQVSTIESRSQLTLDQNMTLYYEPSSANRDLLAMTDKTSNLYLDGCTLKSTETGLRLTRGRLFIDNSVTFSCAGTSESESISFGNGTASDDLDIILLSGAQLTVYGGLYENNVE